MTEEKAERMLAFFADRISFEDLPLDDKETYELFQRADTDGIFMMESDWDKYDLLQVKPSNFDELAATITMSHSPSINPYIYTYLKMERVKPFTYPRFVEMPRVKEILADTHGILLWKEQKEEILEYIENLTDTEKVYYKMAIKIVLHKIERRQRISHLWNLSNSRSFRFS